MIAARTRVAARLLLPLLKLGGLLLLLLLHACWHGAFKADICKQATQVSIQEPLMQWRQDLLPTRKQALDLGHQVLQLALCSTTRQQTNQDEMNKFQESY